MIEKLFQYQVQAHWLHLNTQKYEEHKALDTLYNSLTDLIDKFIETYYGKYGRQDKAFKCEIQAYAGTNIVEFINEIYAHVGKMKGMIYEVDTDLDNIISEFKELCNHTKYMLTLK